MDIDDLIPRKSDSPIDAIELEAVDDLSRDDLSERIHRLEREIQRIEVMLESKKSSMADAESLFKGD